MADKIPTLVQTSQRERVDVAVFLREWADAIEKEGNVSGAVLVLHSEIGGKFLTRTRRCNANLLNALGLLQVAIVDLAKAED